MNLAIPLAPTAGAAMARYPELTRFLVTNGALTREERDRIHQEWERRCTGLGSGGFLLAPGVTYLDASAPDRPSTQRPRSPEYAPIETPPRLQVGPLLCLATSITALIVVLLK